MSFILLKYLHSFKSIMGFLGYHAISYNHNESIIRKHTFFAFKGLHSPFDINKKCSLGFNVGLITHWGTSLSNNFVLIMKFSLIFMNMKMK